MFRKILWEKSVSQSMYAFRYFFLFKLNKDLLSQFQFQYL